MLKLGQCLVRSVRKFEKAGVGDKVEEHLEQIYHRVTQRGDKCAHEKETYGLSEIAADHSGKPEGKITAQQGDENDESDESIQKIMNTSVEELEQLYEKFKYSRLEPYAKYARENFVAVSDNDKLTREQFENAEDRQPARVRLESYVMFHDFSSFFTNEKHHYRFWTGRQLKSELYSLIYPVIILWLLKLVTIFLH